MNETSTILSAYGSHNAALTLYHNGEIIVGEVERWVNIKNAGLSSYLPSFNKEVVFDELCKYLCQQLGINVSDIEYYLHSHVDMKPNGFSGIELSYDHHEAHACGAFYQSSYNSALIFTYDGGGDGGFFNVYSADRSSGVTLINKFNQDLGFAYMVIGDYLHDIKKEALNIGNLVYAGKIMGLCSYGDVREEWIEPFMAFYEKFNYVGNSYRGGAEVKTKALLTLFQNIGVNDFDVQNTRFDGKFAWDIATTSQYVFEKQFFKFALPYLQNPKYKNLPVCLSGGCALNVLFNTVLLEMKSGEVFVPPDTNDCGVSSGALLQFVKPQEQIDLTYSGLPILDDNMISSYIEEHRLHSIPANTEILAERLAEGDIIGIINGNSEHGSRALGNRSILCKPSIGMKEKLNKKVKHREWYRPFAPMVRFEDTSKYFKFKDNCESRHMTFVAETKKEYVNELSSVTHEDGTGRLQTVKKCQNPFIYDLLTKFDKLTNVGVLLNTSFNDNGKPITSTLRDAFKLLSQTEMDLVYYKERLYFKDCDLKKYKNIKNINYKSGYKIIGIKFKYDNITSVIDTLRKNDYLITDNNINKSLVDTGIKRVKISEKHKYYAEILNINGASLLESSKLLKTLWLRDVINNLIKDKTVTERIHIFDFDDSENPLHDTTHDTDVLFDMLNLYEAKYISMISNDGKLDSIELEKTFEGHNDE